MEDGTTLLFGLPGFRVVSCGEVGGVRRVVVMQDQDVHACPGCGVVADTGPYDHREMRFADVPFGGRPLVGVWRKRRYRCGEAACPRWIFTERSGQLPPRCRVTGRLRERLEASASRSARALSDVAREYGVSWWTVNDALVRKTAGMLAAPAPTGMLGVDETRARSVRWLLDRAGWRRSDPWMTSFVDLDPTHLGGLIGLAPGRSGATVSSWLAAQPESWRDGIRLVAIDPSAPFASAVRRVLPAARIVVDHWHLVRLANDAVTQVRQRAAREQLGRRGRRADLAWAHRHLLLRAGDTLSGRALARLRRVLAHDDPTDEIGAAWAVKERLRQLLAARDRHTIAHRLHVFYETVLAADMPETTRLAETVDRWWPEILGFLETGLTNARTEGYNRIIKQIKRVGCGYRNQHAYQRRILLHIAARTAA